MTRADDIRYELARNAANIPELREAPICGRCRYYQDYATDRSPNADLRWSFPSVCGKYSAQTNFINICDEFAHPNPCKRCGSIIQNVLRLASPMYLCRACAGSRPEEPKE